MVLPLQCIQEVAGVAGYLPESSTVDVRNGNVGLGGTRLGGVRLGGIRLGGIGQGGISLGGGGLSPGLALAMAPACLG